ncbi:MAG TPA: MarR family winged helix-turn-helix transcriptional regulator [Stellaceae bacterium]|jgi:DNA-binding MarR family transcriptional regulator
MTLDLAAARLEGFAAAQTLRAARPVGEALDLAPLEALIGFKIHILDLLMYQFYYERLGKSAMTPGMFSTLSVIKANPGVRQGALADALLIQRPNMTLLVNRLIRAGYVRRRAARGDNRGVELFLRAEGERALRDIAATLAAHERGLTAALSAKERGRLRVLLTKMVRQLRAKPRATVSGRAKKAL